MASGKFISLRNFTLRTTLGHTVTFERNKPTYVPPEIRRLALAQGCVPEDADSIDTDQLEAEQALPVVIPPGFREALLFDVVAGMVENEGQNFKLFDAGGRPHTRILQERTGLDVGTDERNRIFDEYKDAKGLKEEYPTHPRTRLYRDVLALNSRKDLEPYAKDFGISEMFLSATLGEAKNMILRAIVEGRETQTEAAQPKAKK